MDHSAHTDYAYIYPRSFYIKTNVHVTLRDDLKIGQPLDYVHAQYSQSQSDAESENDVIFLICNTANHSFKRGNKKFAPRLDRSDLSPSSQSEAKILRVYVVSRSKCSVPKRERQQTADN